MSKKQVKAKKKSENIVLAVLILVVVFFLGVGIYNSLPAKDETATDTQLTSNGTTEQNAQNNTDTKDLLIEVTDTERKDVEFEMTDGQKFTITVYPDVAPQSAQNFLNLCREGFYDGLTFHRVIDGFMAQGGCPNGNGTGGSGKNIYGEFSANGYDNPLQHKRGVVSMARGGYDFNSASSQFFICYTDYPSLDGQYAAFGEVKSGMEVVDSFLSAGTDEYDRPKKEVKIKTAKVIE